jgi:hypothetical protein
MITIPKKENYFLQAKLYRDGEYIGLIETENQMDEVLCQIYELYKQSINSTGFYIIWNNIKIEINEIGRFKEPKPKGFFHFRHEHLKRLIVK